MHFVLASLLFMAPPADCPTEAAVEAQRSKFESMLAAMRTSDPVTRSWAEREHLMTLPAEQRLLENMEKRRRECQLASDEREDAAIECPAESVLQDLHDRRRSVTGFDAERIDLRLGRLKQASEECERERRNAIVSADNKKFEEGLSRVAASKEAARLAISFAVCYQSKEESDQLAKVAKKKADSRIAGVVNLVELKEIQDEVVKRRTRIAFLRAELAKRKLKPLSCKDKTLVRLWACAANESDDCPSDEIELLVEFGDRFVNAADAAADE